MSHLKRESSSEMEEGGDRGRYEVVERVAITAVRPNLISVIDRIRLTKRPNQLDIHQRTKGERKEKGAQMKAHKNLLDRIK